MPILRTGQFAEHGWRDSNPRLTRFWKPPLYSLSYTRTNEIKPQLNHLVPVPTYLSALGTVPTGVIELPNSTTGDEGCPRPWAR